jgi:hypothetical protein
MPTSSFVKASLLALMFTVACGGGGRSNEDAGGVASGQDGSLGTSTDAGGQTDAAVRDSKVDLPDTGGGATDAGNGCKTVCAADDCGAVPNGCDDLITCPACGQGLVCGQSAPNKCGAPPPVVCTPALAADVCAGKCGAVSDGCSGVILCSGEAGGVSCGSNQACKSSVCTDLGSTCTPLNCAQKGHSCGDDGDGCGGTISCGACAGGETCTFASTGNLCKTVIVPVCDATPIADACAGTCGKVGDGCGRELDCESSPLTGCPVGQSCGGGGTPGVCGGGQTCTPLAASVVCAGKCGSQSDGCGSAIVCNASNGGQVCDTAAGESCGGGATTNVCGKPACEPKTMAELCPMVSGNKSCGRQPDGCGNLVDCGNCASDQQCGLTTASVCGTIPSCQPTPVATACAGKCGVVPDGCGSSYTCDSSNGGVVCTGNEYCGANAQANQCGAPPVSCVAKTCAQLGHTCGLASDGCGHVLNCWPSCPSNDPSCSATCGTNAACLANQTTGAQSCVAGGPTCSGSLCSAVPASCPVGTSTKLSGKVVTPGRLVNSVTYNQLPVPNALVYIPAEPNTALPDLFEGVQAGNTASCGRCDDEKLVADGQSVLAAAVTNYKGEYTLEGRIPVGVAFKLVIKVGKWRRVVQIAADVATSCQTVVLTSEQSRLPSSTTDGLTGTHLPKVAVSTGDVDAMECVLLGMGFAQTEFTAPTGTGRVHMYRANGQITSGTTCTGTYQATNPTRTIDCTASSNSGCKNNRTGCSYSNADTNLYTSQAAINAYDLVVFDCEGGGHYRRAATPLSRVLAYTNNGGRVFASHWSYEWLDNNGTLDTASAWNSPSNDSDNSATAFVSLPSGPTVRTAANPVKSLLYRDWLTYQGALSGTTAGQTTTPATPQLAITDPRDVAGTTAGTSTDEWMYRVKSSTSRIQQLSFNTPYAATEANICGRVAFTAFHVAATTSGATLSSNDVTFPGACTGTSLTAQEKTLAFMLFDLATCVSAGDPPAAPACVPKTTTDVCPGVNDACGYISDGCGGVVDCAGCAAGFYCDGNTCRPQQCTPSTCTSLGYTCGSHADGCGAIARNSQGVEGCGVCTGGQTCGLTSPGICGGCVQIDRATACPANSCGSVSDGCGGTYDCGVCVAPNTCGGGGANRCGPGTCTAISMATACANKDCGVVADGCGGTYTCGTCTAPDTCGGAGAPNVCGHPTCTAKTQQAACMGLSCGFVSDGCGGSINCGTCPNGGVCGGAGANKCGSTCAPTTCDAQNANCGNVADQCGSLLNCGSCPVGQVCGATTPNRCGPGLSCTPTTCTAASAECGLIGDGCGAVLDCGVCVSPKTCGGAGVSNHCGTGTGGCNKLTCGGQSVQCGAASDGCGGLLDCGTCPSGSYCQGGVCNSIAI